MFLIIATILMSIRVKRFYVIAIFVIVSHIGLFGLSFIGIDGPNVQILVSALISIGGGTVTYIWLNRYARKHDSLSIRRVKKHATIVLCILLSIILSLNVWVVLLGIKKAKGYIENAKSHASNYDSVEKPTHSETTEETTGFGIIRDPNKFNPDTGKPNWAVARQTEEELGEPIWTLGDEALSTSNTLYDLTIGITIDLRTVPEQNFDTNKVPGLFDGVPPSFQKRLFKADSIIEAHAIKARIEDYQTNLAKLNASGTAGVAAQLAAGIIDADAILIPFSD